MLLYTLNTLCKPICLRKKILIFYSNTNRSYRHISYTGSIFNIYGQEKSEIMKRKFFIISRTQFAKSREHT